MKKPTVTLLAAGQHLIMTNGPLEVQDSFSSFREFVEIARKFDLKLDNHTSFRNVPIDLIAQ